MPAQSLTLPVLDLNRQQQVLVAMAERQSRTAVVEEALDGHVRSWNDDARQLYGYSTEEVVGRSGLMLHDPAEVMSGRASAIFERALVSGKWEGRTYQVRKDGSGFWAQLTLLMRRDASGKPDGLVVVARDLTDIERIEREVNRSHASGAALVESRTDLLVAVRSDGSILETSASFCELVGRNRENLLGTRLDQLFTDSQAVDALLRRATRDGESDRDAILLTDAQNLRVIASAARFGADALLVVVQPPSGWDESVAPRDSVRVRSSSLPPASTSQPQRDASTQSSSPAAELSHELRTPLTAVLGFAELIRSGQAGPMGLVQREYMDDIIHSAQHMLRLLDAELESARAEHQQRRDSATSLSAAMHTVRSTLRLFAARKGIEVEIDQNYELPLTAESATRLQQIVFNYLSNALKFTPEGGRVTLGCHSIDGETLCVEVRDNGVGIDPEQQNRLFQAYEQLDIEMNLRSQGSGLGLAITRRLAQSLGGDVAVQSSPGVGSVFSVLLPIARLGLTDAFDDFAESTQLRKGRAYLAGESEGDDRTLCA